MTLQNEHGPCNIFCRNVSIVQGLWTINLRMGHKIFTVQMLTFVKVDDSLTWTRDVKYSLLIFFSRFMNNQNEHAPWNIHCGNVNLLHVLPNSTFYLLMRGVHIRLATGVACWERTLTPPDTLSCPIFDLHMFYVLRLILFPNLS